ncbi:hypothetical protein R4B61_01740 [Fructilactobacillus vespulae]|uniref:hypothetical protein n=1 Tax=Fructilactobacillus vespulae TaxID=1249630 RepID=UPI0039B3D7D3
MNINEIVKRMIQKSPVKIAKIFYTVTDIEIKTGTQVYFDNISILSMSNNGGFFDDIGFLGNFKLLINDLGKDPRLIVMVDGDSAYIKTKSSH